MNYDTIITHRQESGLDNWQVYLHGQVSSVNVDPNHWLLMNVDGVSRIGNHQESHFVLTPNPAKDKITLHFADPVSNYKLYLSDASGRILFAEVANGSEKIIDVSKLSKGMYFVIVNEKNEIYPDPFHQELIQASYASKVAAFFSICDPACSCKQDYCAGKAVHHFKKSHGSL